MTVLADELCALGDPHGELVQLQLARESAPLDARLAAAEARHLALNAKALLGVANTSLCEFTWRRGFLTRVVVRSRNEPRREWRGGRLVEAEPAALPRLARVIRALLEAPVAAALEQLEVLLVSSSNAGAALLECAREVARRPGVLQQARFEPLYEPLTEVELGGLRVTTSLSLAASVQALFQRG